MSTQAQRMPLSSSGTAQSQPEQPQQKTLADQILENTVEYAPFLQREKIKLSVSVVRRFLCQPTKSGKVCSDADAIKFIMLCRARGLNPFEGDAFLLGYDGQDGPQFSLITAHQAFLKRAETHPQYDGMESGIILRNAEGVMEEREGDYLDDTETIVGGWARVYRKDRKFPTYRRLKLGTYSTGKSRWQKDPCGMIVKCAEADALRSTFPTVIGGMYVEQEFGFSMPAADSIIDAVTKEPPAPPPVGRSAMRNGSGKANEPRADENIVNQINDEIHRLKLNEQAVRLLLAETGGAKAMKTLSVSQADAVLRQLQDMPTPETTAANEDAD